MFDSHTTIVRAGNTSHNVTYNSVAGTLVKSSPDSKILRFGITSKLADQFFDPNEPHRILQIRKHYSYDNTSYLSDEKILVTVLQVMLMANDQLLIEYLDNKD